MDQVKSFFRPFFAESSNPNARREVKDAAISVAAAFTACKIIGMRPSFPLIASSASLEAISNLFLTPFLDKHVPHKLGWTIRLTTNLVLVHQVNKRIGRTFDQFILFMGVWELAFPIRLITILAVDKLGSYLTHNPGNRAYRRNND